MKKISLFAVLIAAGLIVPGVMTAADEKTVMEKIDYREEMRKFVELISARSKSRVAGFYVIGQNALHLVTINGKHDGRLAAGYLKAIDGVGIEELFYGHERAGVRTTKRITSYMLPYLERLSKAGKTVMVVDAFFWGSKLTSSEVSSLKKKRSGKKDWCFHTCQSARQKITGITGRTTGKSHRRHFLKERTCGGGEITRCVTGWTSGNVSSVDQKMAVDLSPVIWVAS